LSLGKRLARQPLVRQALKETLPGWLATLHAYARLMRVDRPIGTWLLLWPTLWAVWFAADGRPRAQTFVVFVLGVVLMRAAGCVINDWADRDLDPHVARTRDRPIATGEIAPWQALLLFAALLLAAFLLVLTQNPLTVRLAFVGAALAAVYPFMKRITHLPQLVLGAAFAWSVPMAYAATRGYVPREAWVLFTAALFWTTAYDTIYAMVDRADDRRIGIRSTAILFGDLDRVAIGVLQAAFLLALVLIGREAQLGPAYGWSLVLAGALLAWQQWLIRRRQPERCFEAFLNNNYVGLAVFAGIALDYTFVSV
jgi:4-hydroxybenzoate polyprenyltransferase